MKTIKNCKQIKQGRAMGKSGSFLRNMGYEEALKDVLGLIDEISHESLFYESRMIIDVEELKKRING